MSQININKLKKYETGVTFEFRYEGISTPIFDEEKLERLIEKNLSDEKSVNVMSKNIYIKFSDQNLVDSSLELYNELNGSYWDLDSIRRIYSKTSVSHCFVKDNPSNCDTGNVTSRYTLKKMKR